MAVVDMGGFEKATHAIKYIGARNLHKTNAVCDCCHNVGKAMEFKYPCAKYYDGKRLSCKSKTIWVCEECAEQMIIVLKAVLDEMKVQAALEKMKGEAHE